MQFPPLPAVPTLAPLPADGVSGWASVQNQQTLTEYCQALNAWKLQVEALLRNDLGERWFESLKALILAGNPIPSGGIAAVAVQADQVMAEFLNRQVTGRWYTIPGVSAQ